MIIYSGPSRIDGSPIVAIATNGSKNEKTGDMIQIWILHSEISPVEAAHSGADQAVCGDCPQRLFLGGGCYVKVHQSPTSVYRAFKRGNYNDPVRAAVVSKQLTELPIRLGAYGDPAAVPVEIWRQLLARGIGRFTGYTHQWRQPRNQAYRDFLMASCDCPADAEEARALGWRYFLVADRDQPTPERTVECLADSQEMSCFDCGICDGNRFDGQSQRASVWIAPHGILANRFRLAVLQ